MALWTLDHNNNIQLLLIDISSAFNIFKHDLLIDRLQMTGLSDTVLLWFISYLQNRYFSIQINDEYSSIKLLSHGVPQGSVIGQIILQMYLLPLIDIFHQSYYLLLFITIYYRFMIFTRVIYKFILNVL